MDTKWWSKASSRADEYLNAKSDTVDTGSNFRAGSNTLRFASGIGEDNAGTEITEVSTSEKNCFFCISKKIFE